MFGSLTPESGYETIPLLKPSVLIGRHPRSDIHLAFSNVSVKHCELKFQGGVWKVIDLGSTNGVKVNNNRVDGEARVLPGDRLTVARKYHYRIEYECDPAILEDQEPANSGQGQENIFGRSLLEKAGLWRTKAR